MIQVSLPGKRKENYVKKVEKKILKLFVHVNLPGFLVSSLPLPNEFAARHKHDPLSSAVVHISIM